MNAKKVKALRKALRSNGVDVTQTDYLARNQHVVLAYSQTTLTEDGKPVVIGRVTAQTNYLAGNCGRAIYKAMKKVNA